VKLLRLAVEMQKWDLAAHVLILGTITAVRRKQNERPGGKKRKGKHQGQAEQR
jgi:hypothetical protein